MTSPQPPRIHRIADAVHSLTANPLLVELDEEQLGARLTPDERRVVLTFVRAIEAPRRLLDDMPPATAQPLPVPAWSPPQEPQHADGSGAQPVIT